MNFDQVNKLLNFIKPRKDEIFSNFDLFIRCKINVKVKFHTINHLKVFHLTLTQIFHIKSQKF